MKAIPLPHSPPVRWQPDRAVPPAARPLPPLATAIGRGLLMRCPACGQSKLFAGYLTVTPVCAVCGTPLGLVRAEDVPPYFTIVAVGHIVVPAMLLVEQAWHPDLWVHAALWLPLTVGLALGFLRPIKGGTVGLMLKLGLFKSGDDA